MAKKAQQRPQKPLYTVELNYLDQVYKGSGGTIAEALGDIETPELFKSSGVFAVTKGDKRVAITLMVTANQLQAMRLKEVNREILAKKLAVLSGL